MIRTAAIALALGLVAPALAGPPQPLFISVIDNVGNALPGLASFTDNDAVSTLLDGSAASIRFTIDSGDLDALHRLPNGNWLVSSNFNGGFNGTPFLDGDVVEIDIASGAVVRTVIAEAQIVGTAGDVSGVSVLPNGDFALCFRGPITFAGVAFDDGDIARYDADTDTASVLVAQADLFDDGDGELSGVHAFADGRLLISVSSTIESISGTQFRDGDIVLYDPADDSASLFFSEDTLTGTNTYDVDAIFFEGELTGGNACVGDFDNDGDVDLGDFGVFGAAFGSVSGDMNYDPAADFDKDGDVDLGDFGVFGAEFGRTDCLD
ncbi:MAG: hypothetical protein AAGH64_12275 [Planctomycetota bacterium]